MIFNIILFFICLIFFIFLSFFLYYGSNIYELITYSNFNFIYNKINDDTINIIKKTNSPATYVIAINKNYIYKLNFEIMINSMNSEIIFMQNSDIYKLNIYNDISKIMPIFSNLKRSFNYEPYVLKNN